MVISSYFEPSKNVYTWVSSANRLLRVVGRPEEGGAGPAGRNWLRPEESNRRLSQSPSSPASAAASTSPAVNSHEGSASPRPSGQPYGNFSSVSCSGSKWNGDKYWARNGDRDLG